MPYFCTFCFNELNAIQKAEVKQEVFKDKNKVVTDWCDQCYYRNANVGFPFLSDQISQNVLFVNLFNKIM